MATALSAIRTQVRAQLVEPTARFWSDAELDAIMQHGIVDLWGAILDLHGDHFLKVDESNCVLRANATKISGVPEDCFRVQLIEPRDISIDGSGRSVIFTPKKFNSPEFTGARTLSAQDPSTGLSRQVFYQLTGAGSPVGAPQILTGPKLSSDLLLRVAYNPTLEITDYNPIPGGSDNALKAWTIAYATAKEGEGGERIPNPGWLSIYATEKQLILVRLTPRQEQEPEVVDDLFQDYY
jgi:hypothetical protein